MKCGHIQLFLWIIICSKRISQFTIYNILNILWLTNDHLGAQATQCAVQIRN